MVQLFTLQEQGAWLVIGLLQGFLLGQEVLALGPALGCSAAVPPTLQGVLITYPGASRCSADSGRGTGVETLTHCEVRLL